MSRVNEAVRAFRVGVVVVIALTIFALGIWVLGESSRVWSPKNDYVVQFSYVQGLSRGSTVSVAGYTIGTVSAISLPQDIGEGLVEVTLSVEREHQRYIRRDTLARIKTIGLLGDKYIDLSPGTLSAPELPPGGEIQVVQPPDLDALLEQGESVAENAVVLTAGLRRIVTRIDRGEGLLGAVISNTPEGQKVGDDIKAAVANLRGLTDAALTGEGTIPMLIGDQEPARDLRQTLASLRRLTQQLEKGEGLAMQLIQDAEFARSVTSNVEQATNDLRELAAMLKSGDGLIGKLVRDSPEFDSLMRDMQTTAAALASVTRRIEAGEGSLGKLIVDDTLYRGLNDILAGASKSRLTRWFVTRSQKAGAEQRLERDSRRPAVDPGAEVGADTPTP